MQMNIKECKRKNTKKSSLNGDVTFFSNILLQERMKKVIIIYETSYTLCKKTYYT